MMILVVYTKKHYNRRKKHYNRRPKQLQQLSQHHYYNLNKILLLNKYQKSKLHKHHLPLNKKIYLQLFQLLFKEKNYQNHNNFIIFKNLMMNFLLLYLIYIKLMNN